MSTPEHFETDQTTKIERLEGEKRELEQRAGTAFNRGQTAYAKSIAVALGWNPDDGDIQSVDKAVRELRAVVDRLPHTRDGKPVVPGDDVYTADGKRLEVPPEDGARYAGKPIGNGEIADVHGVEECYSTKEAAQAARDEAGQEVQDATE